MITFSLLVSKVDYATVSTLITRGKRGQRCYGRRSLVGVSTAGVSGLNSSLPLSLSLSLTHTHALMSLPQSLLHSPWLFLPHVSSIYPRDPKFNYSQGAVGGRLRCSWKAFSYTTSWATASWEWFHCRQSYSTAFSTFLCFNYPSSIAENNTRKRRAAHVLHKFLTDKKISAGQQQRYSHSTRSG